MSIKLEESADAIAEIQRLIDSRRHWIMPVASESTAFLLLTIVFRFYPPNEEKATFRLYMLPLVSGRILPLALFNKSKMTLEQLGQVLDIKIDNLNTDRDLLITPDMPIEIMKILDALFRFGPSPENN